MLQSEYKGKRFYVFALELFNKAGHVFTSFPKFKNHSPEQFIFFDNKSEVVLSQEQRDLFHVFNNVSCLFSVNDCIFYSINLLTTKSNRSQVAHDIHMMIHPITEAKGTVCLFRYDDGVMMSFVGFGCDCILSDWYSMVYDIENLLERLDLANMSIKREEDYFYDMIYSLARDYYLYEKPTKYEMFPIDFISREGKDEIDREEIDRLIEYELARPQRNYGDDYVEYNESSAPVSVEINVELDLLFMDMDDNNDIPFNNEIDSEDDDLGKNDFLDVENKEAQKDFYEFDDVDPGIFRDPTLMVKWLNKNDR